MPPRGWNQERYQELLLAIQAVHPKIDWAAVTDKMTGTSVAAVKQHLLALRHLQEECDLSPAAKPAVKPKATTPKKVTKSTRAKKTQPKEEDGDDSDEELLPASTK